MIQITRYPKSNKVPASGNQYPPGSYMLYPLLLALKEDCPLPDREITRIPWPEMVARACENGVSSLLYPYLQKQAPLFPAEVLASLRSDYERALIFSEFCKLTLQEIRAHLSGDHTIFLIQGLAISEVLYCPRGWIRATNDIDILITSPDAQVALEKALEQSGFTRYFHYRNLWKRKELFVDVHFDAQGADRIAMRRNSGAEVAIDPRPSAENPGFHLPGQAWIAGHSIYHTVKHGFSRALWDFDLALLEGQGCFTLLPDTVRNRRLKAIAYARLHETGLCRTTAAAAGIQRSLVRGLVCALPVRFRGEIGLAFLHETTRETFLHLLEALMPPRAILQQMYGYHWYPVLFFLRSLALVRLALGVQWRYR